MAAFVVQFVIAVGRGVDFPGLALHCIAADFFEVWPLRTTGALEN